MQQFKIYQQVTQTLEPVTPAKPVRGSTQVHSQPLHARPVVPPQGAGTPAFKFTALLTATTSEIPAALGLQVQPPANALLSVDARLQETATVLCRAGEGVQICWGPGRGLGGK